MEAFLESQIGLLEQERPSLDAAQVEDLVALFLATFERLERRIGPMGITEADRPLVPLFQRWLSGARRLKEAVGVVRSNGVTVSQYDDLLRAMNRSKPIAHRFDYFVALNEQLAKEAREQVGAAR